MYFRQWPSYFAGATYVGGAGRWPTTILPLPSVECGLRYYHATVDICVSHGMSNWACFKGEHI